MLANPISSQKEIFLPGVLKTEWLKAHNTPAILENVAFYMLLLRVAMATVDIVHFNAILKIKSHSTASGKAHNSGIVLENSVLGAALSNPTVRNLAVEAN